MAWAALPLLLFAGASLTASSESTPTTPLSYVLADTAFLADEISSSKDGADGLARVLEYLHHVERTVGGTATLGTGLTAPAALSGRPSARTRRHLPTDPLTTLTEDHQGVFLLKKLLPRFVIPAKFPNDVVLFSRKENDAVSWYAAALEANGENPETSLANWLVLYKLIHDHSMGDRFLEQTRVPTLGASTLSVQVMEGWTYLVAAERTSHLRVAPEGGPILYRLSHSGNRLVRVMTLKTHNPSDVFFWTFTNSHYLAVASEFTNTSDGTSFAADTLIYKWLGEHLDIIQRLPTNGARAVTAFTIDSNQYLVVVNHVNDLGETNIQSTVYRFDMVKGKFVVHQHLRTHAAVDVGFFTMQHSRGQDHFLAVANEYYQGPGGSKNYETHSVVYKWASGYFVPFQSFPLVRASQWAPYLGPRGEMVLLCASAYGLHAYQYDGWRFRQLQFTGDVIGSGLQIASLRTAVFDSEGLVVIASKQNSGVQVNVFTLQFEKSAELDLLQEELGFWCHKQLDELAQRTAAKMLQRVDAAPKWTSDRVEVDSIVFESSSTINTVSTGSVKSDKHVIDPAFVDTLDSLAGQLERSREKLNEAGTTMDQALKQDRPNTVRGTVVIQNASVSCAGPCRFGRADVRLLNNENAVSLVNNMIRLDADVATEGALRFSNLVVAGDLQTIKVLGEAAPLVSKVHTRHLLGSLVVDELVVDAGLNVGGTIDGVRVSPETVVLVDGDQILQGFDSVSHWQVDKLVLHGKVNGMTFDVTRPDLPPEVPADTPAVSLSVGAVSLGGLLGGVDVQDMARRALRTRGPQQVTGRHTFAKLAVQDAASRGLNMKAIARTDVRMEKLPGPLRFGQPLVADKVQVYKRLNDIAVAADGSMDLLLNNAQAGPQRVTGPKWLRRLHVTELGRIHGRILGLVLPAVDEPFVRVVHDDILVEGDVTISGRVDVKGTVTATNILEPGSGLTVLNVLRDAVRIDAPLPQHVVVEDLEVSNVDVTIVNGVPTGSWIPDAPGQVVRLTHPAKFTEGLTVTGASTLTGNVNGVSLKLLDETALKTTGDQVITGHKTFPSVDATGVWSNDTLLGGARWLDLWARRMARRGDNGVVKLEDDVTVDGALILKRLALDGSLGGVNVRAMFQDSVFQDSSVTVIDGPKTFQQTVSVDNMHVDPSVGGSDIKGLLDATVAGGTPQPDGNFNLPSIVISQPLSVAKLRYRGTLDGVSDAEWAVPWLEVDGDQTLYGPQTVMGDVEVVAGVTAANGINNFDPVSFSQQVARIDDPTLRLGSVTFDGPVVAKGSVTAGAVAGVNLGDALLARGAKEQEIRSRVVLAGGLEATGALNMEGLLSGEDFRAMCDFAKPPAGLNTPQHLDVKGDLLLDEEAVLVKTINGHEMSKLLKNTWLRDKAAIVTAGMEFGDIQFSNDVTVKGHLDGVNLDAVAQRYLSLTKDETVSTSIRVAKGIKVEGKVVTDAVEVGGLVGGVPLADLPKVVLMDGPDQDVSARMKFGFLETQGSLSLDGTINGLDLARDVVLIKDNVAASLEHNVVLESKRVLGDVHVTDIGLQEGVRVQGVDVVAWNRDAVRVSGDYVVTGSKTLHRPQVAGGLDVDGLVAGVRVTASHLLLRHSNQVITGTKTLTPAPLPGLGLRIQALEVTGTVNTVDMHKLLTSQAYKTSDVSVATPVQLAAAAQLQSRNVWVDGEYQGVNITQMIYAATHPLTLDQYAAQHEALRTTAEHVHRSLAAQGYYLNYYHTAVSLRTDVKAVLPLGKAASEDYADSPDAAYAIAIVMERAAGQNLTVDFFGWNGDLNTIVTHPTLRRVKLSANVRLLTPATYAGLNAIYWEEEETAGVHVGHLMGLLRDGHLGRAELHRSTFASAWASMTEVGDMPCLIRGSPGSFEGIGGFCAMHCLGPGGENLVMVPIEGPRPTHAVGLAVHGVTHVVVASAASEVSEGEVNVWRWEGASLRLSQKIGVVNASSLAVGQYRGLYYLATASGHVTDSPHEGLVHISRFSGDEWVHWMSVAVEGPRALQFSTLPSGQFVLYVATTCPTDSLVVLQYRGVSGFVRRASAAVPMGGVLSAFTTSHHHHLVAVSGGRQGALLQAAFKGNYEASEVAARALARAG